MATITIETTGVEERLLREAARIAGEPLSSYVARHSLAAARLALARSAGPSHGSGEGAPSLDLDSVLDAGGLANLPEAALSLVRDGRWSIHPLADGRWPAARYALLTTARSPCCSPGAQRMYLLSANGETLLGWEVGDFPGPGPEPSPHGAPGCPALKTE